MRKRLPSLGFLLSLCSLLVLTSCDERTPEQLTGVSPEPPDNPLADLTGAPRVESNTLSATAQDPALLARISAGFGHGCAVLSDGTARCWGRNEHGQLGNGTTTNSSAPVQVIALSNATAIAAGGRSTAGDIAHSCALLSDRTARCWGDNSLGQLGNVSDLKM
jgi:alpha-tubulin suppressor-like RCC1 family protein